MDEMTWKSADDPETMLRYLDELHLHRILWRFAMDLIGQVNGHLDEAATDALDAIGGADARPARGLAGARGVSRYVARSWSCYGRESYSNALAAVECLLADPSYRVWRAKADACAVDQEVYRRERANQAEALRQMIDPFAGRRAG